MHQTSYITTHIRQQAGSIQHIQQSMWMWNMLTAQWTGLEEEEEEKNPYSWHNIISMSLLENNCICKDGGGIHYQQLGWNDNTHYTAISLHKEANGSNHSTLINKTLSFVSTWGASSIFHWDSHSWATTAQVQYFHCQGNSVNRCNLSQRLARLPTCAQVRINTAQNERAISEIILSVPRCTKRPSYICGSW